MTVLGASGPPLTDDGYLHEVGFYGSDEDFGALIRPFALGGLEAGEPVIFAYDPWKVELLREWLPDEPGIVYVTDAGPYATPAKALGSWRRTIMEHLARGARRVRIAGNVPHPGYGQPYAGWDRYEAAVDRALGDLPVWAPCLYDTRIAPPDVIETALRRHHQILDQSGHHANQLFEPDTRLGDFLRHAEDPLEATPPRFALVDPLPVEVRDVIRSLAGSVLSPSRMADLLLAATEVVTNASRHGIPPVSVRCWLGDGRIVVKVHDRGAGPDDPLIGLVANSGEPTTSGRGMWLAHQLDLDVALAADEDGFTVRLIAEVG